MGVDHVGVAFQQCHTGVSENLPVDAVQSKNLFVFIFDQLGPIETPLPHRPAIAGEIVEVVAVM